YGVSADAEYTTASDSTIRLITSYRNWDNQQNDGDIFYIPRPMLYRTAGYASESQSYELQFISPTDKLLDGKLNFVAGLYYFREDYALSEQFDLGSDFCGFAVTNATQRAACLAGSPTQASLGRLNQVAKSLAAYGQADYHITDSFTLTVGLRYTQDKKQGRFLQQVNNPGAGVLRAPEDTALKLSDDQPSYRVNLSWSPIATFMAFANVSSGYKSAAISSGGSTVALGPARLIDAETVKDYEVGFKSELFDRRLLLNATAFRSDIHNFQDRSFNGASFVIRNAGDVRAKGLELEGGLRVSDHLRFDGGAAYLDSIYTSNQQAPGLPGCTGAANSCPRVQDLSGQRVSFAPKYQFNLAATVGDLPVSENFTAKLRVSANYVSKHFMLNDNNPQAISPSRLIWGARAEIASHDGLTVSVFGDNLT
ncbi:MAG: TonB-dependent receptor, partial [Phenylobacterium sp.]